MKKNQTLKVATLTFVSLGLSATLAFAQTGTTPVAGENLPKPPPASSTEAATTLGLPNVRPAPQAPSSPPAQESFVAAPSTSALPPLQPSDQSGAGSIVPVTPPPAGTTASGMPSSASGSSDLTKPFPTPQIVQDAVTRLQKTDQINLDDMIRAQDAINRLDLLLEIEKRQTELKKIRDERNKPAPGAGLLGAAIPASALSLPTIKAPTPPSGESSSRSSSSSSSSVSSAPVRSSSKEISEKIAIRRITGTGGRYLAVIDNDGKIENVKSGDKLGDGSKIKSISLTEVVLTKDGKSKTLTIPTDSYIVRESGNATE